MELPWVQVLGLPNRSDRNLKATSKCRKKNQEIEKRQKREEKAASSGGAVRGSVPAAVTFTPPPSTFVEKKQKPAFPPMSMYVRVKRKKQTVFLTCEPSDTILDLKRKLSSINSLDVSLSSKRERARACETVKDRESERAANMNPRALETQRLQGHVNTADKRREMGSD